MFGLEQYSDIFGKPSEGVHSTRILGVAFWDLFLTIILIIIIVYTFDTNFIPTTIVVLLSTVLIHRIFEVPTALNTLIFGKK